MTEMSLLGIAFIFSFLIQLYFQSKYFIPFIFHKSDHDFNKSSKKPVSVIICAHNELKNLKTNLISFLNQHYEDYEVILVNDRSKDGTKEWLNKVQLQNRKLKVIDIAKVPNHYNPKKYAITIGVKEANNEILLLSDADCKPSSSNWIDRMSSLFTNKIDIVLGVSLYHKGSGFLSQFINFETLQTALLYLSFAHKNSPYMGVGRNIGYRKSFFLKTNGFDGFQEIMGGDDDLWVNKNANKDNTEICISPDAITFSTPKSNWKEYLNQKKRHLSVGKYYKNKDKFKLGLFHFSQTLIWILLIFSLILGSRTEFLILSLTFLLRLIGQYVVFYKLSINFGILFRHYFLPITEFFFVGFYWIWGVYASLTKHHKWK